MLEPPPVVKEFIMSLNTPPVAAAATVAAVAAPALSARVAPAVAATSALPLSLRRALALQLLFGRRLLSTANVLRRLLERLSTSLVTRGRRFVSAARRWVLGIRRRYILLGM